MAAAVNGEVPPPPSADFSASPPGKRKRDTTPDPQDQGKDDKPHSSENNRREAFQEYLKDLTQILSKYDINLGIFQHPLSLRSSAAPENKRQKLSESTKGLGTIESRIQSGQYQTIRQFVEDIETAEQSIHLQPNGQPEAPTSDIGERTRIFKRHLNNLIRRHPFRTVAPEEPNASDHASEAAANGHLSVRRDDKSVLTVLGNAPRGRQLFSSLPKSDQQRLASDTSVSTIDDADLPTGVVASSVVPFNTSNFEVSKARARTLGDVFAPRPSLPPFEPPRKRDLTSGQSPVVTWLSPIDAVAGAAGSRGDKRYFSSSTVPLVPWITYGYQLPNRPSRKKQRTGSAGDNNEQQTSQNSPREGAGLVSGTYSSFAPSFDSGGSVVSSRGKGQFWWGHSGPRHFRRLFPDSQGDSDVVTEIPQATLDEETLKDTVDTFEPVVDLEEAEQKSADDSDKNEKETDEILEDISELLRTLDSYRQLRHLDQATSERQDGERPTDADNQTTPSEAEFEIYKTLKSSLSAMISTLPPFALAKLDGEQLADLNISKRMLLDGTDYPGTMEEDDYTLHQRQMSKVSQAAAAPRSSTANVGRTPPVAPYQRYPPRARQQSSGVSAQQQAYANRTPSAPYQPHGSPQHPTPLQPSSQRANYAQQPQYPQQQSPTPHYTRAAMLQQFQRPTQNGNSPNVAQRTPSSAQPSPAQQYQRPAPPNYQRAPDGTYRSPVPGARTGSPQKPGATPQRQYVSPAANQTQPRYFQQSHQQQAGPYANMSANQASTATPPYSNSPSAMAYSRNAAEQAALMERNKTQSMGSQVGSPNGQSYQARGASQEHKPST